MLAKGYLFDHKGGKVVIIDKLFVPCDRYYPDDQRIVVLQESPCKENNYKSVGVLARYLAGKYYGITTGGILPVILSNTVWTESSIAEGPYYIADTKSLGIRYGEFAYPDFEDAANHINNLNMQSCGDPCYTVVNMYGVPVDADGHLYF